MHLLPRVVRSKSKIILQFDHGTADPRHVHQVIFADFWWCNPVRQGVVELLRTDKREVRLDNPDGEKKGLTMVSGQNIDTVRGDLVVWVVFESIGRRAERHLFRGALLIALLRCVNEIDVLGLMVLIPIFAQPVMSMKNLPCPKRLIARLAEGCGQARITCERLRWNLVVVIERIKARLIGLNPIQQGESAW